MNARQYLAQRLPRDIVFYIFSFNLPKIDDKKNDNYKYILYKHLAVFGKIDSLNFRASSALFINYRGHAISHITGDISYSDYNEARILGARNTARIKNHIEKYTEKPTIFYKWRFNMVMGEINFINTCIIKQGTPAHFEDYKHEEDSDDEEDATPEKIKYYKKRVEMLFNYAGEISEHTHPREFPQFIRRIKKMKQIKERTRAQHWRMCGQLRQTYANYKECIRNKPTFKKYDYITYLIITQTHANL